jgi:hypothetical protein
MHPTDMQLLKVTRYRDMLHTQITRFLEMTPTYLGGNVNVNDLDFPVIVRNSLDDNYEDYSDFDEDQNPGEEEESEPWGKHRGIMEQ